MICRSCAAVSAGQQWLILVSADAAALAGEIASDEEALAVRTPQKLQVDLAGWYIRHSMALAAVLSDLGRYHEQLLAPETRALLESVEPRDRQSGWLDHMRALVRRGVR